MACRLHDDESRARLRHALSTILPADDDESRRLEDSMSDLTAVGLSDLLDEGIVVRGDIELRPAGRRLVRIDVLSRCPGRHRQCDWLIYETQLPRLDHPRGLRSVRNHDRKPELTERWLSPEASGDWEYLTMSWPSTWLKNERNVFVICRGDLSKRQYWTTVEQDPRFISELPRVQMLIDHKISNQRGPQANSVRAYNMLGHLIDNQHRAWNSVYPS
jgi:hypothetical protein